MCDSKGGHHWAVVVHGKKKMGGASHDIHHAVSSTILIQSALSLSVEKIVHFEIRAVHLSSET